MGETEQLHYGNDYYMLPVTSFNSGEGIEIAPDLYSFTVQIVNVSFVGKPGDKWVLIDAGMPGSADQILKAAEDRYGSNSRPEAIILTHGHFDHVGAIIELIDRWDVPVYAHEMEMPFLTGNTPYHAPDTSVEGGLVAKMSFAFPVQPIQLGDKVQPLPSDGTVPFLEGWRWIHTPGHTPGHVSLYRDSDRSLIAGDAFVTVRQDALYKVIVQEQELTGPPRYLTPDWESARKSVETCAALRPALVITGHGVPMKGEALASDLQRLADEFDQVAVPDHGVYVH